MINIEPVPTRMAIYLTYIFFVIPDWLILHYMDVIYVAKVYAIQLVNHKL